MAAQSSLQQFLKELPPLSAEVAAGLLLKARTPATAKTRAAALAKRGYLGCYPFAHIKSDDVVLRLLPETTAAESPIAVIHAEGADPLTIAPNLTHFVAGRLAQIDYCNPLTKHPRGQQDALIEYAEAHGGGDSARAVLEACKDAAKITAIPQRMGRLWSAAKDFDPLFEVLGGAWSFSLKEVPAWLRTLRGKARSHRIARNIRVSYNTQSKSDEDVADDAWAVVFGDQVFDRSYTGITRGRARGAPTLNAVHFAVTFLRRNQGKNARFASLEWAAAQAAVDEAKYDGSAHLRAAEALLTSDPVAAYTQLANAAFYAGQSKSTRVAKIVRTARDLAKKQKWSDLADVLAMSITT